MRGPKYLIGYSNRGDDHAHSKGGDKSAVDRFLHDTKPPAEDAGAFALADLIVHRRDAKGDKDDFGYDKSVDVSDGRESYFSNLAQDLITHHGNDLGAIQAFAKSMSFMALSANIVLRIGDDAFVFAFGNTKTISVSAEDDVYIFAAGNKGSITAKGEDVYVYAPDNTGSVSGTASATAKAFSDVEASARKGDAVAVSLAVADADADVFIYTPNNHGTVSGQADAVSVAKADADAHASGDAVAIAIAESIAASHVFIHALNDHGTTTAFATASATAYATDTANAGHDVASLTTTSAISESQILIG